MVLTGDTVTRPWYNSVRYYGFHCWNERTKMDFFHCCFFFIQAESATTFRLITFAILSLFLFTYYTGFTKRIFKYSYLGTSSERNLTVKLTHLKKKPAQHNVAIGPLRRKTPQSPDLCLCKRPLV